MLIAALATLQIRGASKPQRCWRSLSFNLFKLRVINTTYQQNMRVPNNMIHMSGHPPPKGALEAERRSLPLMLMYMLTWEFPKIRGPSIDPEQLGSCFKYTTNRTMWSLGALARWPGSGASPACQWRGGPGTRQGELRLSKPSEPEEWLL